ncbi:MAG: hypothetical protein AAF826_08315 [Pseudomonadota bacterium]
MSNIIETSFGTRMDPSQVARGRASGITKKGAFYTFSIRVEEDDIREYSFSDRRRAEHMRAVLIGHLEAKIKAEARSRAS